MPMTAQEAIRRLKREGWTPVRQTGSHIQFVKKETLPDGKVCGSATGIGNSGVDNSTAGKRITVPIHRGDLTPGVERDIKRKAGW